MVLTSGQDTDTWEGFRSEIQAELDQAQRALGEISLMLEHSQVDMTKLTQRNTAITVHLQQVQAQIDSLPRTDIRLAYDAALDSQQRLFVMRGQMDKLQSDQTHLNRLIHYLDHITRLMEGGLTPPPPIKKAADSASVEMLINTQEAERQRLSRQMHDGPAQALSNFILQTEIATRLFDIDQVRAKDELGNLKQAAMNTFQKVRNFIFDLRPMMLDDLGLVPTAKRYTESFKETSGIDVDLVVTGPEHRLEPFLEVMVFRALQELLGNVAAHSQASLVKIHIDNGETEIRVTVEDNGKGFDPNVIEKHEGFGLHLMRERSEMLGGSMLIDTKPGEGTRIVLTIPTVKEVVPE